MKRLLGFVLLILVACSQAADFRITSVVQITNNPSYQTSYAGQSNSLVVTVSGATSVRWWTNVVGVPASQFALTNSTAASVTNMLIQLSGPAVIGQVEAAYATNGITNLWIRAPMNSNITVSVTGIGSTNWAAITYFTNQFAAASPILTATNAMDSYARTNAANAIANLMAQSVTNAIPQSANALSNFVTLATQQSAISNKVLYASSNYSGLSDGTRLTNITSITGSNGVLTAMTNVKSFITNSPAIQTTNLVAYSGSLSNIVANNFRATNLTSWGNFHIGDTNSGVMDSWALQTTTNSIYVPGYLRFAIYNDDLLGSAFEVLENGGVLTTYIGNNFSQDKTTNWGIFYATTIFTTGLTATNAKGAFSGLTATNLQAQSGNLTNIAGAFSGLTATNAQIQGGNLTNVAGAFSGITATNATILGGYGSNIITVNSIATNQVLTGGNTIAGSIAFTPLSNIGLNNGYNGDIMLGSNVITKISGPSGAYTNVGFVAQASGTWHILQFSNPASSLSFLNNSGLEGTDSYKITTGTGGEINLTNNPAIVYVHYDASTTRWIIGPHSN